METESFYDKYKSIYYQFGAEKTVTIAFCELFTANCLEVKKSDSSGQPTHLYRFKSGASPSILHKVELIVAEQLRTFNSFPVMLGAAKPKIKKLYKINPANIVERLQDKGTKDPVDAHPQFRKILEEALQQNALTYNVESAGC